MHPRILLDIRYATDHNFMKKKLYSTPRCFLRKSVADKLARIQDDLEKKGLGLKIFDGYRPLSVQKMLWELLPDPRYVADPQKGSCHNRGAAVDLTLVDEKGNPLEMPTDYDDFTFRAHRDCLDLPEQVIKNRDALQEIMLKEGFIPLATEWWHFDDENWQHFPLEDRSFEELEVTG